MGQAAGDVVFAGLRPPCGQPMAGYFRFAPVLETMEATTHAPPTFARVGVNPGKVHMAMLSRKGYWRMSQNELVRIALNNRWLEEQGVPDMRPSGWFFTTGLMPESGWNRPVRSRTQALAISLSGSRFPVLDSPYC